MQELRRTPLYEQHVAAGARMVPFAGWEMPVQYEGVLAEHRAVRTDAGVFDVSHMGEIEVEGPQAGELLQRLLSNDLERLSIGEAQYTLLTNEAGGILDDTIVYRTGEDRYLLIVNASNRDADFAWLRGHEIPGAAVRDVSDEYGLLAVQGPRALERLGLPSATPFTWAMGEVDGVEVMINRTGYTGEEGVELACAAAAAPALWDAIQTRGVTPCGLGARDTLRLEVCYPLHGNDISPQWDAISSGLGWVCALDTGFIGAERLSEIKARGPERKLVAFRMTEQAIPRQGMAIEGGGEVTSGSLSPMLELGIGLGYVPAAASEPRDRAHDRRPRTAAPSAGRQETDLQEGGVAVPASESYPDDLRYHRDHDWARIDGDEAVLGVTWWAADSLGELVHYEPPAEGSTVTKDLPYGEVESVKAVSDLIAPLSGEVLEVNAQVVDRPETVNEDPYGDGWLIRIRMSSPDEVESLLTAEGYGEVLAAQ